MTTQQAFEQALEHHLSGRLPEAETLYRQILVVEPGHGHALHCLGVIAHQVGRNEIAADLIRKAIGLLPGIPDFHSNLGETCRALGHLDEAITAYRQAVVLRPNFFELHYHLGNVLYERGQVDHAITAYRQAIALKPNYPEAYSNLGVALYGKRRLEEAIAAYRQAIAFKPNYPEAYSNLGNALCDEGNVDEAIAACRQAIVLKPDLSEAHYNLGNALYDKGRVKEAIAAHRQAIALKPNYPEAHYNLGNALHDSGQLGEAIAAYRQVIAIRPHYAEAHYNLGNALKAKGRMEEAVACYRRAIGLKADFLEAGSNLLLTLHYDPVSDALVMADEARRWNRRHGEPLRQSIQAHGNDRARGRRLRVGYVSPDFREHPVALFLESLLARHDRTEVEVFCYSDVPNPDAVTVRMEGYAGHWRKIAGMSESQVADLIRSDGIDILVDLAGHTAGNRLVVFARKPAPVQVTWLGYPNTTGLDTIDFRLSDALADPPGSTEALHSEELVRLPVCAWCFRPSEEAPPVSAPPVQQSGGITFGCFNAMPKINAPLLELWCGILRAVPGSRVLLKNRSLQDASTRGHLQAMIEKAGIAPERVELMGPVAGLAGHLAAYGSVDIALDTFPYHGTTTTCEALWMGVPVVTLAGKTHVSRVGVSLLENVGLPGLVAASEEQYIELAVRLAEDLPGLAELRRTLRARMAASPLMDAPRFAGDIEAAYRQMWRAWCMKHPALP